MSLQPDTQHTGEPTKHGEPSLLDGNRACHRFCVFGHVFGLFEDFGRANDTLNHLTGTGRRMGCGTVINTPCSLNQLAWVLALCSNPFLVKEGSGRDISVPSEKFVEELLNRQVLSGLKILDIGCGPSPAFARVTTAFGAETWTVDRIASSHFNGVGPSTEAQRHIQIDLSSDESWDELARCAGGPFDFVTASQFESVQLDGKRGRINYDKVIELLRPNGYYYIVPGPDPRTREGIQVGSGF